MKNGCFLRLARLGLLLGGIPLEVAVGRQQAAARRRGPAVGRLLGDRLHPGVDHPVADLGVLGPGRDQPPLQHPQLARGRLARVAGLLRRRALDDGVDLLGRRDVVVGRQRLGHPAVDDLELLDEVLGTPAGGVAAAHGPTLEAADDGLVRHRLTCDSARVTVDRMPHRGSRTTRRDRAGGAASRRPRGCRPPARARIVPGRSRTIRASSSARTCRSGSRPLRTPTRRTPSRPTASADPNAVCDIAPASVSRRACSTGWSGLGSSVTTTARGSRLARDQGLRTARS